MPRDRFINFVALSRTQVRRALIFFNRINKILFNFFLILAFDVIQVLYDSDELGDGFLDDSDKKQQDFFNKLFAEVSYRNWWHCLA